MSLTDYLAKNYLTADTTQKQSKKRKRKEPKVGISIADDDLTGWNAPSADGDDDRPTTVVGSTSEFRKAKTSAWKTVGAPTPKNSDQTAADEILASAAAEQAARDTANADEDAPQVMDEDGGPTMVSGAKAGLQSAASVTAAMENKARDERKRYEADPERSGKNQDTIYRDGSGRIINVAMKRAEARRAEEDAEKKKLADAEALKGDVQRVDKEKRRQDLKDAKYMGLSRYADDAEMNEELKERDRWNDPAAQFLTKKKEGKSTTGKPLYKGSSAPNRYGIRPGYRWDGVDRSNGFEKEYFQKKNEKESIKNLRYQWEMDE